MRIKLGVPMRLSEIAEATKARLNTKVDTVITAISTDTRELFNGDLFIAIKGEKYNGEDFLLEAKGLGAYSLSSSDKSDVICPDSLKALSDLAAYYAKNLPNILYNIAITGSVGKTTTKEFAKILLSTVYKVHASESNYNNEIGMPMSILSAKADTQILLMEMGMNHPGEISRMSKCLRPDIGLITNIGTAHIGNLGSRENIALAKMEIADGMSGDCLILPFNEPLLVKAKAKYRFSCSDPGADIYIKIEDNNALLYYKQVLYCSAKFHLPERHHIECLLCAASIAIATQVDQENIARGISLITRDNTRQTEILKKGIHFYLDCYNASYESVLSCIRSAEAAQIDGKKHLMLGDILELGDMAGEIHFRIGTSISKDSFDFLFLFGNYIDFVADGAIRGGFPADRIFYNYDLSLPERTAEQIKRYCSVGDTVFMKASRGVRLERVVDCFFST